MLPYDENLLSIIRNSLDQLNHHSILRVTEGNCISPSQKGIKEGDKLVVIENGDQIILKKVDKFVEGTID